MKQLEFKQEAAQRIYDDYIKRINRTVATLSNADQQDIQLEFNSHIYESMQGSNKESEIDSLLDVLQKLGAPEEVLTQLVADKKLEQATKTFNPAHIFKALALNISNGISYTIFALLYLILGIGVFSVGAKIFYPDKVGFYVYEKGWSIGIGENSGTEVLGNWFIPVMLSVLLVLYILTTLMLRLIRKLKKKKKALQ
jgi:HAAS